MAAAQKNWLVSSLRLEAQEGDFLRKSAHSYATRIGLMAGEFLLNIVVTRLLGPEGRGGLALAGSAAGVVSQFGMIGQNAANVFYSAKRRIPLGTLLSNSLLLSLLVGLLFMGGLAIGGAPLREWMGLSTLMLLLVVVAVPLQMGQQLQRGLMMGRELVYAANHLEIQVKLLQFVLIGLVLLGGMIEPETVFAVGIVVSGAALVLGARQLVRHVPGFRLGSPSIPVFHRTAGYGGKAYVASLLSFAVLRVDIFLINHFLGLESAGLYAAGMAIVNAIYVLPSTLSQLLLARLSSMRERTARLRFAGRIALLVSVIMAPLLAIAWYFAYDLFILLFGVAFADASFAFQWLLPGVFIWSVEANLRKLYSSNGFASWIVYAWALAFLVNLGLNLVLIPDYGISGAAVASSLALGLVGCWTFAVFAKDVLTIPGSRESRE